MGDHDDGFDDETGIFTVFQYGHSDGYTHTYGGPLYMSRDAAEFAGKKMHGNYAVEAKAMSAVRIAGRVYLVDGPYKTFEDVEMEEEIRKSALSKLTAAEKKVLGIK